MVLDDAGFRRLRHQQVGVVFGENDAVGKATGVYQTQEGYWCVL